MNSPDLPPHHWDPRPGSKLRAVLVFVPAVIWGFAYPLFRLIHAYVRPRHFRAHSTRVIRGWGRGWMIMFGVKVEFGGLEHLQGDEPKIIMFNHVNLVDIFILSGYFPEGTVLLYKREFHNLLFIGRAFRIMDMIPVDRQNPAASHRSIRNAAERIRERKENIMLAPEGTRSRTGKLGRFKMGPFHLAAASHVPIVPMIMRGLDQLLAPGDLLIRPGCIRVDYLPPISTEDWGESTVREHAAEVRKVFERYLESAPEAETATA